MAYCTIAYRTPRGTFINYVTYLLHKVLDMQTKEATYYDSLLKDNFVYLKRVT